MEGRLSGYSSFRGDTPYLQIDCNELAPKRAKPDSKLQKRPTKFLLSDLQFCIIAVQVPFSSGMLFRERVYKFAKHVFAVLPGWAVKVSFSSKALF